jgi:radical SAM superfamily enzyme YgiQ (UPF0313 family)
MRIVLFYPRGKPFSGSGRDAGTLACVLPPVGLASIAAVLRQNGSKTTILDGALNTGISNDEWAIKIQQLSPDWVGFSAITSAFEDALDVCRRVKKLLPGVKTVFGGVHASWARADLLVKNDLIDYCVAGEGEYAMNRLVNGEAPDTIPGVFSRKNKAVISGPLQDKSSLANLDTLPFPAYDLLPGFPKKYELPLFGYPKHPGAHIISSRGCIYQCSYCDRSVFGKSFRWNSPAYTLEQIRWLKRDFGVRHINFYDDLFTLNRARVEELCRGIRDSRLGITFNCIVRVGHIDIELISTLKNAGCWMVNVGIESGDQDKLDSFKDGLTIESIRRDVTRLYDAGIHVKGLFMMGFPGETETSIKKTLDFACSLPLKDANITAFTPFPGAPVTKGIETFGTLENDLSKMDCVNFVFVPNEIPSKDYLEQHYRLFLSTFYQRPFSRKMFMKMLFQSPHSYWRLLKNLLTFLKYKKMLNSTDKTRSDY